jgi:hypothetical protein
VLGTNTSASVKRSVTLFAPENNAMMTFVSRRNLPGIRLDFFAAFLNGLGYYFQIRLVNRPGELQQFTTGSSERHTQSSGEVEHLSLLGRIQPVNPLNDLVFYRPWHSESNLGNACCEVKLPWAAGAAWAARRGTEESGGTGVASASSMLMASPSCEGSRGVKPVSDHLIPSFFERWSEEILAV